MDLFQSTLTTAKYSVVKDDLWMVHHDPPHPRQPITFCIFMGFPIQHPAAYFCNLTLVVAGIGSIFTLIGAIATKANQAGFLAPVLSLPVILP